MGSDELERRGLMCFTCNRATQPAGMQRRPNAKRFPRHYTRHLAILTLTNDTPYDACVDSPPVPSRVAPA